MHVSKDVGQIASFSVVYHPQVFLLSPQTTLFIYFVLIIEDNENQNLKFEYQIILPILYLYPLTLTNYCFLRWRRWKFCIDCIRFWFFPLFIAFNIPIGVMFCNHCLLISLQINYNHLKLDNFTSFKSDTGILFCIDWLCTLLLISIFCLFVFMSLCCVICRRQNQDWKI